MKTAIRIALCVVIAMSALTYFCFMRIPLWKHDQIYTIAAAANTLMLFLYIFLFGLLEITNYFGLFGKTSTEPHHPKI